MDYRAELQILLYDENMKFETWLSRYPIQECPNLILEYKKVMQKYAIEIGDFKSLEELQELDELADKIENFTIDTYAAKQEKFNEIEALKRKIEAMKELFLKSDSKEISLSDEVLTDLREIVKYLKSHGLYDEEMWKPLKHLL